MGIGPPFQFLGWTLIAGKTVTPRKNKTTCGEDTRGEQHKKQPHGIKVVGTRIFAFFGSYGLLALNPVL